MNIGIDIDDTINNLNDILFLTGKEYNRKKKIQFEEKNDRWVFEEAFGWNEENIEEFLKEHIRECFHKAEIKESAKEVINKLKEQGNRIVIITARSEDHVSDIYNVSRDWLIKSGINFDKLVVNSKTKAEECIENKIDIFIDDTPYFCEQVKEKTTARVLLMDSVYNKEYVNDEIERIYNWKEIYEKISKY